MDVRVRFAPSPTGPFSLGNARTALFNWLFARREGGVFLVRIEDTDKERSKKEYEEDILEGLSWLGFDYDETVERQSEHTKLYEQYLQKLLDEKKAYYCFCTPEELEAEYQSQLSEGLPPRYSGKCKLLRDAQVKEKLKTQKGIIRFRMPETTVSFTDLVRGNVEFKTNLFGDIIIAKGLHDPLYNFAVVVDDYEMRITHVIRGEDHLSNTPKQIMIQKALDFKEVHYGHLPLILGPDKKKLSKRYMAVSLSEYKKRGYVADAMFNFLILLGWHPEQDREIVTRKEALKEFSIKRVQKSGGIFNEQKLNWLNAHYIRDLSPQEFIEQAKPFIPPAWFEKESVLLKSIPLIQERIETFGQIEELAHFIFKPKNYESELLVWKNSDTRRGARVLESVIACIQNFSEKEFTQENILRQIINLAEREGRGETFWPVRVALSGEKASPGPVELAYVLGKEESLSRLREALRKIQKEGPLV